MSPESNTSPAVETGLSILLPLSIIENFENADAKIDEIYGVSPGVPRLVRLWLACSTASRIRREFELAVLDIKQQAAQPNAKANFDHQHL
jgi:hypothetical protein